MALVKLKDVVMRVKDKVDRDTADLDFYIGGEHFDYAEICISRRGVIQGSTIGPAFHMRFQPGDVLLMSRNPHLRKAGVVDFEGICSDVSYVCRTKDESVLLQRYLPFIFQTDHFWDFAESNKKGSTNFFLNWSDFEKYEFNLPPIEIQRELTELLWAAENTKLAYIDLLRQTDELVKSQFIEMFGDMESNPKGWRESTLGTECYYIKDGPHKSPPYIDDQNGIPFISTRNIVNGDGIDWSTAKYISEADYLQCIKKCKPEKGDILYSKGGTTGIAKYVDTDKRFANWVHVAVLKFGDQLDGRFLERMLNMDYCYRQSQQLTKGIANRDFVLSAIAQVKIFVPPIELQRQYVRFVEQSDKSKFELKQAIERVTNLMKSLMQQDFVN